MSDTEEVAEVEAVEEEVEMSVLDALKEVSFRIVDVERAHQSEIVPCVNHLSVLPHPSSITQIHACSHIFATAPAPFVCQTQ